MFLVKQLVNLFKNSSLYSTGRQTSPVDLAFTLSAGDNVRVQADSISLKKLHPDPDRHCSGASDSPANASHLSQAMEGAIEEQSCEDSPEEFLPKDDYGGKKTLDQDDSPTSTPRERIAAAQFTEKRLEELTRSLHKLCRESDPQFVKVGRDLTIVTQDVKKLTETVHHAVSLIQNDKGKETSLQKTEELVQDVFTSLTEERQSIDEGAVQVESLVSQIFQCRRIREMIDRINSLFRIVRVNIRIQCSARGLSDELFEDVSNDLDHLSKTLHQLTKQILRDINQGAKSLVKLQKSIFEHIKNIDQVFRQTKTIVANALNDIRQLMHGAETMIREADSISKKVSRKVDEVVISIQFHDSLNQRVEHIIHAFEDITRLCGYDNGEITEQHLGTAFIILDLQQRQLVQLSNEIRLVRERIESDFLAIEQAVEGLGGVLHDKQFREVGPQQFMGSLFTSLEGTMMELNFLLAEGDTMLGQIEETTGETRIIANNLIELKENVTEIREETRVQAVNTIIMASNLGQQGKTIEVLAKEIQALSDKSGVLADDIEAMQLAVSRTVEQLIAGTSRKGKQNHGNSLKQEIRSIKSSFSEIMGVVAEITRQIEISGNHIKTTRAALFFLDSLSSLLDSIVLNINRIRDKLAFWDGKGTHDSVEIEQLIERYSMAQERMIHMFDRVDAEQDEKEESDVFF